MKNIEAKQQTLSWLPGIYMPRQQRRLYRGEIQQTLSGYWVFTCQVAEKFIWRRNTADFELVTGYLHAQAVEKIISRRNTADVELVTGYLHAQSVEKIISSESLNYLFCHA